MRWIYRGGAATLVWAMVWSCTSGGPSPSEKRSVSRSSRPAPDRNGSRSSPDIELDSLLTEVPEYEGRGRNLFAYGRPPRAAAPPASAPTATTIPAAVRRRSTTPRPSTPAQPRLDLKFAGFVEKSGTEGGDTKKYAVFLSGAEILTGAEGEMIANRYKIVEIGLESVTISVEGSGGTQKIPLRTN